MFMQKAHAMSPSLPFNFDQLAQLARTDPAAFEAQRRAVLETALDFAPRGYEAWAHARVAEVQVRGAPPRRAPAGGSRLCGRPGAASGR